SGSGSIVSLALLLAVGLSVAPFQTAHASYAKDAKHATISPSTPAPPATVPTPSTRAPLGNEKAALLDELRNRLHPPADCQPNCAALAQLRVTSEREKLTLALNLHVAAATQVPLPGHDTTGTWHPTEVLVNGKPAQLRRDDKGQVWLHAPKGIHQLTLSGPLGASNSIRIPLPMPPRMLTVQSGPWQLSGVDSNGLPRESLLNLDLPADPKAVNTQKQLSHVPDALPGFALVERTLFVGERWQTQTRITRQGPSRAPVRVRFALLPGESINDERVQIKDGAAEVLLSGQNSFSLSGTLPISNTLTWTALPSLFQIERWQLQASAHWHPAWEGLTPIHHAPGDDGLFAPSWQPWPGESLRLRITPPEVIAGPTLTLERQHTTLNPGQHSTTVETTLSLRASLAGTHSVRLPADAEFLGMSLDGNHVPVQAQQARVDIPVVPGEHQVQLRWREARGMAGIGHRFQTQTLDTQLAGTNAITELTLPYDRVVLAAGGPLIGPAVLFWGFMPLLLIFSVLLARSKRTPLGFVSWFLLLIGLAQASMLGAAIVATGLLALGLRPSMTQMREKGWQSGQISGIQIGLGIWTAAMLLILYQTVHTALLGYPNMLITGNGANAHELAWYQDRFTNTADTSWIFSISLTTYRVAMLAWALWLASSLLGWTRWGWQRFSDGGYWPEEDLKTPPPTGHAGPKRTPAGAKPTPKPAPGQEPGQAPKPAPTVKPEAEAESRSESPSPAPTAVLMTVHAAETGATPPSAAPASASASATTRHIITGLK
ncbi:MAG: hypothetical protein Q4D91_12285, partial [Lautropia sp.]|nr:hypothetical protein [Lautropia sp.]